MHMTKKTRNTMKPPSQAQSSPVRTLVFEGVYNNARMLHFLTAVVGSTCDVRVKNGTVYEGIFKTLSSQCELAVDAVHKRSNRDGGGGGEEGGGENQSSLPKMEDITDTMIFSPADLVTMTCRDVDLNFAVRDTFTDSAISSSRVNGEHREKVLQRWDGDGNGDNFELEADTSNGWDANEMFKFNEEAYGVKSTYDSSLSMYTMPLERGNSEVYRQREARAARLANEIENNLQYRRRVSLENDEGRSEEDKYSSVVREREDRASPGFSSATREGKYIPLPQRAREISLSAGNMRGGSSGRTTSPTTSRHPPPSSSSPRPPSDRSSPLSVRTALSPHQTQSSPPAASSPPSTNHVLPHSLSHPQALADTSSVNGVASRTSPKSQRLQTNRNLRTPNSQSSPAVSRTPKPDAPLQDLPPVGLAYPDSSPSIVTTAATTKPPSPRFPVDVNEIPSTTAKERNESLNNPQEGKSSKASSVQQRSQLEELRKFGKEFRLQPSSSPSASSASADPSLHNSAPPIDSSSSSSSSGPPKPAASSADLQQTTEASHPTMCPAAPTPPAPTGPQSSGPEAVHPALTPSSGEESCPESSDQAEAVNVAAVQVKNSTLNPNAKEFLPFRINTTLKPTTTPTPPRPVPPTPSVVLPPPGQPGGAAIYSNPPGHYLSYVSPISIQGHSIQAPQMYQYTMSTVNQGKYPRAKGPVVGARPEHHASPASPMLSAAASAAGPPLVASPYPQSYLQYGQVIQAMPPHYHSQTVYSMLQGGARMLTSGAPPQPMGLPAPQYPGQAEGPPGPQQAMYAPQSFSHHSGSIHPQPSSTPTGNQPPPQHTAPSPGHAQSNQAQPQSLFHSGGLSAPTPPNLPPGHSSPQASYTMPGYGLPPHQPLPHGFASISQLTQAHVTASMSGPHHSAGHGHPPVMLHYAPPQQGGGSNPQHGPPPQQGAPQHFYIGPHQAVQVQAHPTQQLSFHPSAN